MTVLRSLLYAAIFYPGTVLYVLAGIFAILFGRRPALAIVLGWMDFNGWLCRHLLGIRTQVVGTIPDELQPMIFFAGALTSTVQQPEAASALIRFLASPEAAPVILKAGLMPLSER